MTVHRVIRLLSCVLALTLCGSQADAGGTPPPPPAATTIVNYDFNAGSGYGTLTPALASGVTSAASGTQGFATISGAATDGVAFTTNGTAGHAMAMPDSSGTNTNYFQFQLSGASLAQYRHYKVYVQAIRGVNAAPTLTLAYSTNGATFTAVSPSMSLLFGTYVSQVFDLTAITALDHRSSVQFRLMTSGATANSVVAIDNFQVQAEGVACPSAFTVDGTGDTPDVDPGDGVCADGDGACTLRAALSESNALGVCSAQTINVTARGTIALGSGLPTITQPLTIQGPGANVLAVSGNSTFRLVNILLAASGAVTINDLSFTHGGKGAGENATALEFNNVGTLALNRDEFYGNAGPGGSSVIFSNAAAGLNMTGSTVRDNAVEHVISIGNTPFTIFESTIANNTGTGSAIFVAGAVPSATISSATITNNTHGLWHANTAVNSSVTIRNSIFSQNGINLRRTGVGTCAINGIVSGGFNLIDSDPGGSLCSSTTSDLIGPSFNPQLSALGYYGGTTQTRLPALGSPAIDKGHGFGDTADQRGSRRTFDRAGLANASGGDATDIGAVELGFIVNSLADPGDASPDGACDSGGGVCTLREAIQEANATTVGDTISFAADLTGTIALGSGLPTITRPLTILGPGANVIAVGGNNTFRLVNILLAAPGVVTINNLAFTGGGRGTGENATALEFNNVGSLVLDRDEFSGNSGPGGSSVIFSNAAAALTMTGASVHDNAVEHVVSIGNTPFGIFNSTIANNTGTGSAIFLWGAVPSATIASATITNNTHGLWHANTALPSSVTIRNSIFSQNGINLRRTGVATCDINGIVSGGYNLIDSDPGSSLCVSTATDLIGVNPQLAPLGSFGGPTRTRPPLGGSPVIDRGSRFGLVTDQRGQARPFDNTSVAPAAGGDDSDIGAFELQSACGAVTVNPATLLNWNTSFPYTQQLTASGAISPYTFTVVSGSLPAGVSMAPSGALSGTPTGTGTSTFSVLASSANGCYGMRSYTITVSACTTISLTPASLPPGVVGTPYSQTIVASGGAAPYTFGSTGTLPAGLALSTAGVMSGTPSGAGSFPFTATATASNGCTGAQSYTASMFARPTALALSSASVAENSPIATTIGTLSTTDADSSTFTYTLVSGTGSADNASFTISGNLLQTNAALDFETKSSYSVRVRTTDPNSLTFERAFTIAVTDVNEAPTDITLSATTVTENNAAGTIVGTLSTADQDGAVHTYALVTGTGSDDNAAFAVSGTALAISVTADFETKSSYSVRVRSTDQAGLFVEKAFVVGVADVNEPPAMSDLLDQNIGMDTSAGPLSFTIENPETADVLTVTGTSSNVTLVPNDPAHIAFAGAGASRSVTITPAAHLTGTTLITVSVSDGTSTVSDTFAVNVGCTATITLGLVPAGVTGTAYAQSIAAGGGSGSYTFAVAHGSVATGLTLSSAGLLAGVPTQTGTFPFRVTATDTLSGCAGSRDYALTIGNPVTAGQIVISEFRLRGSNEFVELANTTSADIVVSSNDASAGWAFAASDGAVRFIIPNGTTIPARGHFLAVNANGYTSSDPFATGDAILLPDGVTPAAGYAVDIPDGAGLALFKTAAPSALGDASNRLDAAGFDGIANPLYYEGATLTPVMTLDVEHAFVRRLKTGLPQDTDQNRDDFVLVSPVADAVPGAVLGLPGPENTTSPLDRTASAALTQALIDSGSGMSASTAPNRERHACGTVPSAPCGGPTQNGEMLIRRKLTNDSATPITRLRFRIVDLTTYPAAPGTADLRVLSSTPSMIASSSDGLITVQGTVLEAAAGQVMQGAGLNATLSCCRTGSGAFGERTVSLTQPLAPGETIYVQWRLGVRQSGSFRFYVVIETLP